MGLLLAARIAPAQAVLILQPGATASTLAGSGVDKAAKPGAALLSPLGSPRAIAYDSAGVLYIADTRNHQVFRVDQAGNLTIVAGTGRQGYAGDGGQAALAELNSPGGIAVNSGGNVLIADTGNHRVRRIGAADGVITTVAGSATTRFSGSGGTALNAGLGSPQALATSASGTLYIADTAAHRVLALLANGTLSIVAGNGLEGDSGDGGPATAASIGTITGLTALADGRLLLADGEFRRVRAIAADGSIGPYSTGTLPLRRPAGLTSDGRTTFVADAAQQTIGAVGSGGVSPIAGSGGQGKFQSGSPLLASLDTPVAIASGPQGDLSIADAHNHQIQRVAAATLDFGSIPAGTTSAPQTLTLAAGGAPLTVSALEMPASFATLPTGTTCTTPPFALQPGRTCAVAIVFAPQIQGSANAVGRVGVSGGASQALLLKGTGTPGGNQAGTATALRSDGTIAYAGTPVSLTATVAGALLTLPIGNVMFLDGTTALGTAALSSGTAIYSTSSLITGAHAVRAVYSGDAAYSSSTSPAVAITVVPTPDFTLSSAAASYSGKAGDSLTVPLTVLPVNGTLNRAMTLVVTGLPAGATATFAPSTFVLGGTSTAVSLTVQMPPTLARVNAKHQPLLAMLCMLCPLVLLLPRHRKRLAGLWAVGAVLGMAGCGSGFRAGTTQADLTSTTRTYNVTVTATTTGVLGTPLAHSTPVGLVITR